MDILAMIFILTTFAVLLLIMLIIFVVIADANDKKKSIIGQILENKERISDLENVRRVQEEKMALLKKYNRAAMLVANFIMNIGLIRKIAKLKRKLEKLEKSKKRLPRQLELSGYVFMKKCWSFSWLAQLKKECKKCYARHGSENAEQMGEHLLAQMFSNSTLTLFCISTMSVLILAILHFIGASSIPTTIGFLYLLVLIICALLTGYSQYEGVMRKVKKREAIIKRQFPSVLNSLAILVTANVPVSEAWRVTAISNKNSELHKEMQRTWAEIENGIMLGVAYRNFSLRLNNMDEALELSTAMIQATAETNEQVEFRLRDIAKRTWEKRLNIARIEGDKTKERLGIPSILLLAIVVAMLTVAILLSLGEQLTRIP